MSNITSSSLFHFTDSADKLIGILKDEFKPNFHLEKIILGKDDVIEAAFPMVCFCDIPLSQIENHVEDYGDYGIGLSKEWAQRKGLNPVLYLKNDSFLSDNLKIIKGNTSGLLLDSERIAKFTDTHKKTVETLAILQTAYALSDVLRYAKNYEGHLIDRNNETKVVTFYNEREWRYVPKLDLAVILKKIIDEEHVQIMLSKEQHDNPAEKAKANAMLEHEKLSFEPNDIKYIIVKEEKEIITMINTLSEIKSKYDRNTIAILTSRIITSEQIRHDF